MIAVDILQGVVGILLVIFFLAGLQFANPPVNGKPKSYGGRIADYQKEIRKR
jgi:hypothetical protein